MNKEDLKRLVELADLMNLNILDDVREVVPYREEIIHYLDIIKEENPDGFWYYSKNYNRATLYFLNMAISFFQSSYPIKKDYKLKEDTFEVHSFTSNFSEKKLDKIVENYCRSNKIVYQDIKEGILYAIKNHIPTSYLNNKITYALFDLDTLGLIKRMETNKMRERRVIYYLG